MTLPSVADAATVRDATAPDGAAAPSDRYRVLFERSPDPAWVSRDGVFLLVNPAAVRIFKADHEDQLIGTRVHDRLDPDYRDLGLRRQSDLDHGAPAVPLAHMTFVALDGTRIHAEVEGIAIEFDGAPAILASMRDVARRLNAENALAQSTGLLDRTGALAEVGGAELDLRTGQAFWTTEMCRILDVDPSHIPPPERWVDFFDEASLPAYLSIVDNMRRDGSPVDFETPMITARGRRIWVRIRSSAVIENGRVVKLVSAHQDITERKRADQALAASEERLRMALEATSDALWDWDLAVGAVYCSPRWFEMLGYPVADSYIALDHIRTMYHPDDAPCIREAFRRAIEADEPCAIEGRLRASDGTWRWIHCRGRVSARDAMGRPTRFIGVNTDIHATKLAEERALQLEAHLQKAQKLESVGRLAGGVAHDFNNMLGVILGHTELALAQPSVDAGVRGDLVEIQRAAERSAALTRQLLAFARQQIVSPSVMNVNDAVSNSVNLLRRLIGENIPLTWRPADGLWDVRMDPSQVDQVLANLCVNARDAIPDVGSIVLATANAFVDDAFCTRHAGARAGEYVTLTVSDDGVGMDHHTLSNIFEPFFTTKATGRGTGLGLATVYGIVEQNNGFITVSSTPGAGSTFTVYLPRYLGSSPEAVTTSTLAGAQGGHETILLVEDEPAILALIARVLGSLGYRVLRADGPRTAIHLFEQHRDEIHLLMTDVIMPMMNGRNLADHLHTMQPSLPVLFMSGYPAETIVTRGVLDDGVTFLQKPFSTSAIAAQVRAALDR